MNEITSTLFWLLLGSHLLTCLGIIVFAARRGRHPFLWFVVAFLLTPPVAFAALVVLRNLTEPCAFCREPLLDHEAACGSCGKPRFVSEGPSR